MVGDKLAQKGSENIQWYEDEIPIRGCRLSLGEVKAAFRELMVLVRAESERLISNIVRIDEESDSDYEERKAYVKERAFQITISIIGFDGQSVFGDTEGVFDSNELPVPVKTIYFTNKNAFKPFANGELPPNRFEVWLHFDKPPLFDPNPLVSQPTPNLSNVIIYAEDVGFFRAVQKIISEKLSSKRHWYSFIHEKFAYDIGLWFVALPYSLYWTAKLTDKIINEEASIMRIAFFIYIFGISLIVYRAVFGYLKWAFPVVVLEENNDNAKAHRVVLGAILIGVVASLVSAIVPIR